MDKSNQAIASQAGHSSNMAILSTSKKERAVARILATKFHTEPATDPGSEVRLNPIMRDLIINRPVVKKKWSKQQKTKITYRNGRKHWGKPIGLVGHSKGGNRQAEMILKWE
jgi:hypothetical protein